MKFLLCLFLAAISCQVILCEDQNVLNMINKAVPQILQNAITKGKLPGGPYYLHHVIKSSIGAKNSHFTLDVRQLDNQTVVTVKATIDNTDFSVKASCFTSQIGEGVWALTKGWKFTWLFYAPNGRDEYCKTEIRDFRKYYTPLNSYTLSAGQLTLDSAIKIAYQNLEDSKKGIYSWVMSDLIPGSQAGPYILGVGNDDFTIIQNIGPSRDLLTEYYLRSEYQPCTGDWHVFMYIEDIYS